MKNNKYLKLETGQVVNYDNNPKELKENDFNSLDKKRLFSIFSGGDGIFDKKDYDNLWNLAEKYAKKNDNAGVLDDDECQAVLDELVNADKSQDKIYNDTFRDFLLKVFQKQDKIVLKDTADLNVNFHEMKEKNVLSAIYKEKENASYIEIAEKFFNPDNLEYQTEYYNESSIIKTKTILGANGQPERMMFFDDNGEINKVELKTETGYQIIDFKNHQYGEYAIKNTSADKTVKSETDYILGQKYKEFIYDPIEGLKLENTYDVNAINSEENYLKQKTEYNNGKKYKTTKYNSAGITTGILKFVYDNDWDPVAAAELLSYDGQGNLISRLDNKTNKEFDGNGNEIIKELEIYTQKLDYWGRNIEELTKILNNPNDKDKKEQLSVLVEAVRRDIDQAMKHNYLLNDSLLQEGKNKLNGLLDECLIDKTDSAKIKSNIETVLYMINGNFNEFSGFAYTDTPNGKYDQYVYQNTIGDCWLLSSLDALSEIKGGQDYINSSIQNNHEEKEITIKLMDGKVKYTFTYDEIDKAYGLSVGDADAKAIEMAYDKYFKEFKPGGKDNINGNWMKNAYWILSGTEPVNAVIQNGKAGVIINGEFIEISKKNRNKLKHIPIDIKNITPEIMAQIKDIQDFTAKTISSVGESSAHAYYITDISDDNNITVKEPHNPTNARTYTQDYYNKIYKNEMTIFVI